MRSTGLSLQYVEKDQLMGPLLQAISERFGDEITFKGGTALSWIFLSRSDTHRFSEDFDIDIRLEGGIDDKLSHCSDRLMALPGFQVDGPHLRYLTARYDCRYVSPSGRKDMIRIDMALGDIPFLSRDPRSVRSPISDGDPITINVYSVEDLLAQKVMALYGRTRGKDVYDVYHGLEVIDHTDRFVAMVDLLSLHLYPDIEFIDALMEHLTGMELRARQISTSTTHYIRRVLRPDWIEMIRTLRFRLKRLLSGEMSR